MILAEGDELMVVTGAGLDCPEGWVCACNEKAKRIADKHRTGLDLNKLCIFA
jgi:hypothetical protein